MGKRLLIMSCITVVFSVVLFSLFTGCCIFGGGKKKEEVKAEEAEAAGSLAGREEGKLESGPLDLEIPVVNGSLNWSRGFIQVKGFGLAPEKAINPRQGRLLAFRAAYADALSSLLQTTAGVQVTASTTVKDYITQDNTVELRVEGIIKGAREIGREYHAQDKTAVVQLAIYLEDVAKAIPEEDLPGGTINFYEWKVEPDTTLYAIAGEKEELVEAIKTSDSLERIEEKLGKMSETSKQSADRDEELLKKIKELNEEIARIKKTQEQIDKKIDYTGIAIYAAGSGIKPLMAPSIYYKSGDELKLFYGNGDGRVKKRRALVGWVKTLSEAVEHNRVMQTPFVVEAIGVSKEDSALIISADDAKAIEKINKDRKLLENCRIVIIP